MKLGSISRMLGGVALTLMLVAPAAMAAPSPAKKTPPADQAKTQTEYPNATRKEPMLDLVKRADADKINEGTKAVQAGDAAKARDILGPYAAGKASKSRYAQVIALQGLANLDYSEQKTAEAIAKLKKAIDIGVMPNDTYFGLLYELAQLQANDGDNQGALDTLEKWRDEGKRDTADSWGLEGILDYQTGKYKEAIAAITKAKTLTDKPNTTWDQVLAASYAETGQGDQGIEMARKALAANPDDQTTRHNLISLLLQNDKYDEALKVMEEARAKGEMKTSDGYLNMAKLYLMAGQNTDKDPQPLANKALSVLKEGLDKKVLTPSYDVYKLEGDAAIIGGFDDKALAAYDKAAPLGKDGTVDLMRARLLAQKHKYSASRTAAQSALSKGTKHKGRAYVMIAEAERASGNRSAAIAAMKKATQDPETRSQAEAWLRKTGN